MTGAALIKHYFPEISPEQESNFLALEGLYAEWNQKINVISRKDIDHFYERHVLHSLALAKFYKFKEGTNLLDIGTGGGFPGIPMAILLPGCRFTLVDSIGKKTEVVKAVAKELDLKNVEVFKARAEDVKGLFDFGITRAVAPFAEIYQWVGQGKNKKVRKGIFALKGGDLKEELSPFKGKVQTKAISDYFEGEFFETKKVVYLPL